MFCKVTSSFIEIEDFKKLTLIGDPGCDGLGAATMSVFAKALSNSKGDITLILGDIVPMGSPKFYNAVIKFINQISTNPIYTLCGNHDSDNYEEFCGEKNYALYSSKQLVVILDNSTRTFSDATVDFFNKAIGDYKRDEIIISFHIPPQNSYTGNSIPATEWQKLLPAINSVKDNVVAIVAGHVHSFFRDEIEGIPLIVSGGGGARIEFVNEKIPVEERVYHIVEYVSDQKSFDFIPIGDFDYTIEVSDRELHEKLSKAYSNEIDAHFRYKLYSEQMKEIGEIALAKLFKALSESEYYHAKNHYSALGRVKSKDALIANSINCEAFEINEMYKKDIEYTEKYQMGLSNYSFTDSYEAEKVHLELLENAQKEVFDDNYYICTSCGYTFSGETLPTRCPICGAPIDKIKEIV